MFYFHSRPVRRFGPNSEHIQLIFESFFRYTDAVSACLDSNLWPGDRKSGCSDSFCYHLAKRNTKNTNWYYQMNSSACCSDWQVRAPIRCQFSMATHPWFFQPFETASQDAPFFLPQCCCHGELLPDGLLTLLEKVWDLKHRRMLNLCIASWVQTHMHGNTHTCSRAMCVSPNSLWQRVFAVFMLHHSLSSLTAWPSNTAFQWQLKFNTYKFFKTLIQLE